MRKTVYKAFTSKCQKCSQVRHIPTFCKNMHNNKTKEEPFKANTVFVMHSTVITANSNLCQSGCPARKSSTSRPSGSSRRGEQM
jgi:hypothetical protein